MMGDMMYAGRLLFYKHNSKERIANVAVTYNTYTNIEKYARQLDRILDALSCEGDDYIDHTFVSNENKAERN